jgi:hypothetical protein
LSQFSNNSNFSNKIFNINIFLDPLSVSPQKALETIGSNLQKQYERWQPRARYKQSLDPTVEEVKKLCTSLRRNAKEERVLFHYNGHGVPKPTTNGEIWVFNRVSEKIIKLHLFIFDRMFILTIIYSRRIRSTFHCRCMTYKLGWVHLAFMCMIVQMQVL